jgi:predicted nuclease with TOPRIM domain
MFNLPTSSWQWDRVAYRGARPFTWDETREEMQAYHCLLVDQQNKLEDDFKRIDDEKKRMEGEKKAVDERRKAADESSQRHTKLSSSVPQDPSLAEVVLTSEHLNCPASTKPISDPWCFD